MSNAMKETLTFAAAASALAVILFTSARAEQPQDVAANFDAEISGFTQSIGADLLARNSAEVPVVGEVEETRFAAEDDLIEPIRFVSYTNERSRSAWFDTVTVSIDR